VPEWIRKTRNYSSSKSDQRNDRGNEKIEKRHQSWTSRQTDDPSKDRHYIGLNPPINLEVLRFNRKRRLQKTF